MKKNREEPHQNPQFWHLVPKRALLRDFPPSGTLYHFFSQHPGLEPLQGANGVPMLGSNHTREYNLNCPLSAYRQRSPIHLDRRGHAGFAVRVYPTLRSADSTRAAVFARSAAISLFSSPGLPPRKVPLADRCTCEVDRARVSRSLYFKVQLADLCICEVEAAAVAVRVFCNSAARYNCS